MFSFFYAYGPLSSFFEIVIYDGLEAYHAIQVPLIQSHVKMQFHFFWKKILRSNGLLK